MTQAIDELHAGLSRTWIEGNVYEARILNTAKGTVSGYFDSPDAFAHAIAFWDRKAAGIYMTVNPVSRDLLARAQNRLIPHARNATNDGEIARRCWLPLDFDPIRSSGISSNEAEHQAALGRAIDCARWLIALGFQRESLVFADSGNGAHLLIRVDLPGGDEANELIRDCLSAVALLFDGGGVQVDVKTGNAARIWKVYGTHACKGEDTNDRPHRLARILTAPNHPEPAAPSLLAEIARHAPVTETKPRDPSSAVFDLDRFVQHHLAGSVVQTGPWNGGRKVVLNPCPFNADHTNRSAVLIEHQSGALSFTCHHNGCAGNDWKALRAMLEPRRLAPAPKPGPLPPAHTGPIDAKPRLYTLNSMNDVELERIAWLWHGKIPGGKLTIVEGDPEARKTWLVLMAISAVTRGWRLPGDVVDREPGRVLLLAGEDGYGDTIKPRLAGMGADMESIRPVLGLIKANEEEPLTLTAEGVAAIVDEVEVYRPDMVVIDPLIAYTGQGVDMNKANEVRGMLRPLTSMAQRHGVAVVATRHLNKLATAPAAYRGQGSIDYLAIARSVLLVVVDRENPLRSIVVQSKSSLAQKGKAYAFTLNDYPSGTEFMWDGELDITAQEVLAVPDEPEARSQLDQAKEVLMEVLFEGPVNGREVKRQAEQAGVSERTLQRAKTALRIITRKDRAKDGQWLWSMSGIDDPVERSNIAKDANISRREEVGTLQHLPFSDPDDATELMF